MHPAVGTTAPSLSLRSQHGQTIAPVGAGRAVLLVFFPFAFSGICSAELSGLSADADVYADAGVDVAAISCDPVYALRALADRDGLRLTLLSDFWPHGEVARAYGCFDDGIGAPRRSSFLLDAAGTVRWSVHHDVGDERPAALHRGAILSLA